MILNIPNVSTLINKIRGYEANGQLGNSAEKKQTGLNLNNYKTAGVYVFSEAYTPVNAPEGVVNGWLIVLPWSTGDTCKQVFLRHDTPNTTDLYSQKWTQVH